MIQSIGIDIVDIERMTQMIHRWGDKFLCKILTPREYAYCHDKFGQAASVAARFAAKEALYKALPADLQAGTGWLDVEVVNDASGRPRLNCFGKIAQLQERFVVHVSISHSKVSAVAMVLLEQKGSES
ncbi:holo-ACP synthase [candidate division KSB1 bacterium]|nr:holo-ACP synthase [candidate division KSB1 bacterium]RQW09995.1 MAG: holo-[acyl-carrier-protein] synthase [candidate division KSB1 bacterium]